MLCVWYVVCESPRLRSLTCGRDCAERGLVSGSCESPGHEVGLLDGDGDGDDDGEHRLLVLLGLGSDILSLVGGAGLASREQS